MCQGRQDKAAERIHQPALPRCDVSEKELTVASHARPGQGQIVLPCPGRVKRGPDMAARPECCEPQRNGKD
eukprot:scaffold120873_cov29-Tisochrysis_lutea.AAC.1